MATPNKALREWLTLATAEDARQLAKAARTSVAQLRHIAHGRRKASAALAQRLAHSSRQFSIVMRLDQRELCDACGACQFAKAFSK